jgi:hypothetical protein
MAIPAAAWPFLLCTDDAGFVADGIDAADGPIPAETVLPGRAGRLDFIAQRQRSLLRSQRRIACAFGAARVVLPGPWFVKPRSGAETRRLRPTRQEKKTP